MHFYKISSYFRKSIENSLSNSRSCFLCCFCCCSCCLCQLSWQLNVACLINTNCRGESKQREARSSADQKLAKPDQNQDCEANCGQAAMLCAPLLRQQQQQLAKAAAPLAIATCCCWWCNGSLCWSSLTLPAGSQLQMARLDAWLVVLLASWSCRTCCSCQSYQSWMGHRIALPWRTRALHWYLGEFKTKIRMWHTHDRPVPRPALLTAYCCCCSLINYN